MQAIISGTVCKKFNRRELEEIGNGGALQNGTFSWSDASSKKMCIPLKWDPLGYGI